MSKFENGQRFKRDYILGRVLLHLAQQRDVELSRQAFTGVFHAYQLVSTVFLAALEEDLRALNAKR